VRHVLPGSITGLFTVALLALSACGTDVEDAPTAPATSSASTSPAPPAGVELPPVAAVVDYQLGGPYDPDWDVQVVTRDRSVDPAPGLYSICYVNAFQTQPDEADFWLTQHPDLLLRVDGDLVEDAGWPGEYLLDVSTDDKRRALAEIVGEWIDGCAEDGYSAVEPDNLDSATRSDGALDLDDAYAFATLLAERAHARGLAIAQKNTAETSAEQARSVGFDFAVTESCGVYDECADYTDVYGANVIEIEYSEDGYPNFERACAERGGTISVLYRDHDVLPRGVPGYEFDHC
jgi:hypothetical protein